MTEGIPTPEEMFKQWTQNLETCAFAVAQNFNPEMDYQEFMREVYPAILRACMIGKDPAIDNEREIRRLKVQRSMSL